MMDANEFHKRLLQPKKRKKPTINKCQCGRRAKYTDGERYYCDKCLGEQKVIH